VVFEMVLVVLSEVFFFSSRRLHARFSRDWSSDVCSSDLLREGRATAERALRAEEERFAETLDSGMRIFDDVAAKSAGTIPGIDRSEERRVGKESKTRSSWLRYK